MSSAALISAQAAAVPLCSEVPGGRRLPSQHGDLPRKLGSESGIYVVCRDPGPGAHG